MGDAKDIYMHGAVKNRTTDSGAERFQKQILMEKVQTGVRSALF